MALCLSLVVCDVDQVSEGLFHGQKSRALLPQGFPLLANLFQQGRSGEIGAVRGRVALGLPPGELRKCLAVHNGRQHRRDDGSPHRLGERTHDPQALAQVADTLSQQATVGRLRQVCDRWIYSACLCFGLDAEEQARSGFRYAYSVYQAEYSRNLLFRVGAQMDRVFNTMVDRTRSRLDVPMLRTLFGAKQRPGGSADLSPRLAVVIETPRWDLTLFKVHFGRLTLKGYTKGEHVLRFEAVVHNTKQLGCGRAIEKFPEIVTRLQGMAERFSHHPGLRRHRLPA